MALDDLSQPEAIEALIKDGRVPVHFGTLSVGDEDPKMSFWLPPQGVKIGDKIEGSALFGFRFKSPEGEDRGSAEMHIVPMAVGEKIRDMVNKVLDTILK